MKAPLWRQKPCFLIGKEVSQLEAPGWLARSMAFVSEGDSSSRRVEAANVTRSRLSRWTSFFVVIWSAYTSYASLPFFCFIRDIRGAVTLLEAMYSSSERREGSRIPRPPCLAGSASSFLTTLFGGERPVMHGWDKFRLNDSF